MTTSFDYLIVGGGMVADAAAHGIRERDPDGSIGILGDEADPPFPRPALSKKLWTDPDFTVEGTDPDTAGETGATIRLSTTVVQVDPAAHIVTTSSGEVVGYSRLLLATGGHPRTLDGLPAGDRVIYFRRLVDYRRLRELAVPGTEVVVVGGGYIGTEIAAALVGEDCSVTLVHPDRVLGASTFPSDLADTFEGLFTEAGVAVQGGLSVEGGREEADGVVLDLSDGSSLRADVVVLGLGIEPAGDVAGSAVTRSDDGGITVDERLATSAPEVWAAGDVADYPDPVLGRRRVEHVDNAQTMGAAAGRMMAGSDERYEHTPMFYSDVLGHGYEAVGDLDASLDTVTDELEGGGLVVYYADAEAVRGVLLWDADVEDGTDRATALLASGTRPDDLADLRGSLR